MDIPNDNRGADGNFQNVLTADGKELELGLR